MSGPLDKLFKQLMAEAAKLVPPDMAADVAVRKAARELALVALKRVGAGVVRDALLSGLQDAMNEIGGSKP